MKTLSFTIVLATLLTVNAKGAEAIYTYSPGIVGYVHGTAGWTFQPTTAVTVTSLGCFDYLFSVPSQPVISVGLWAFDGALLASNSITTNSSLLNQTRYEPITPITLTPGQSYALGAYSSFGYISFSAAGEDTYGSLSMAPEIQLGHASYGAPDFSIANIACGPEGSALMAPNFLFEVPEPSLAGMMCLGALSMLAWRKAR